MLNTDWPMTSSERYTSPGWAWWRGMEVALWVNVKESRGHDHIGTEILQGQVQHFNADAPGHLCHVLARDGDPLRPVLD